VEYLYKRSLWGYGKESVQEAVAEIEKNYTLELKEVDEEIEEAVREQKQLNEQLKQMIAEYKRLKEHTRQLEQLKEYMPLIVSQKKLNMEKEAEELRKDTEEYIHNIQKHCVLIDEEIEKVKQKIQVFVRSLSQLFVLRDVKEFNDTIRHFEQVLEEYKLPGKAVNSNAVVPEDFAVRNEEKEEEPDPIEDLMDSKKNSLQASSLLKDNILEDSLLADNEQDDKLPADRGRSFSIDSEELLNLDDALQESLLSDSEQKKNLAEDSPKEKTLTQNKVRFSVQDDEMDELDQLLKQLM